MQEWFREWWKMVIIVGLAAEAPGWAIRIGLGWLFVKLGLPFHLSGLLASGICYAITGAISAVITTRLIRRRRAERQTPEGLPS